MNQRAHASGSSARCVREDVRTDQMRGNQLALSDVFRALVSVPTLEPLDGVQGARPSALRLEPGHACAPEHERILVAPFIVDLRARRADAVTSVERHAE